MAIQKINNALLYGLSGDTKPTTYADNTLFFETDTGDIYQSQSGVWSLYIGAAKTETHTNKMINLTDNTVTDTSTAAGDLLKSNGTKFVRMAMGTAHQSPVVNVAGTDIAYMNPIPTTYDYIISKVSTTYYATKHGETVPKYSNTSFTSVINSATTDLGATGGTVALAANTEFIVGGGSIDLENNISFVGMDNRTSTIKATVLNINIFYWDPLSGDLLTNASIKNLHLVIHDPTKTLSAVYIDGSINFTFENNWVESKSVPATSAIAVFLNTDNGTHPNINPRIINNIWEGSTNGQDNLGMGLVHGGIITGNQFINIDGQGIGVADTMYSVYANNYFEGGTNSIGFENTCEGNTIVSNTFYNSGGIKLSQYNTSDNISRFNICSNNVMMYGSGGIEDGNAHYDTIENNHLIRSSSKGIWGSFHRCTIRNNEMVDTNSDNLTTTINSVSQTNGGIIMRNNAAMADCDDNIIAGNKLIDTGATFTDPTTSTSESGNTGPIVMDTNYDGTILDSNQFIGLASNLVDYGTGTITLGAPTDAQYVTLATNTTLTNERTLAASKGLVLTDAGAGNAVTLEYNPIEKIKKWIVLESDFDGEINRMGPFYGIASGTGTGVVFTDASSVNEFGIARLSTGSTETGRTVISSNRQAYRLGGGVFTFIAKIRLPTALSDGTNTYIARVGYLNSSSGEGTDGVYFEYNQAVSDNWRICTMQNSTQTKTSSNIAVPLDTWQWLKIVSNAAGTSVAFYINGTEVTGSPITTNLPNQSTDEFGAQAQIFKSVGTTSRHLEADFMGSYIEITTARTF